MKNEITNSIEKSELLWMTDQFREIMENNGYKLFADAGKNMSSMTAIKENHYRFKAICHHSQYETAAFTVQGNIGTDVKCIFYFIVNAPFNNVKDRFFAMAAAMEPFIRKELTEDELRIEF